MPEDTASWKAQGLGIATYEALCFSVSGELRRLKSRAEGTNDRAPFPPGPLPYSVLFQAYLVPAGHLTVWPLDLHQLDKVEKNLPNTQTHTCPRWEGQEYHLYIQSTVYHYI